MSRTPKRGDIVRLTLDPALGIKQQGARPVLVLSPEAFNRHGGALRCPITQGGGFAGTNLWAVPLMGSGTETQGVVLTNQARTIDWKARGARHIESVPQTLVDEVLARVIRVAGIGVEKRPMSNTFLRHKRICPTGIENRPGRSA